MQDRYFIGCDTQCARPHWYVMAVRRNEAGEEVSHETIFQSYLKTEAENFMLAVHIFGEQAILTETVPE